MIELETENFLYITATRDSLGDRNFEVAQILRYTHILLISFGLSQGDRNCEMYYRCTRNVTCTFDCTYHCCVLQPLRVGALGKLE